MKRLYETWPGDNRFFCGGRLLAGPDRAYFYLSISFIIVPLVLSAGFLWPYLFIRIKWYGALVPLLVYFLLATAAIVFMLLTRYRDPGIIPRGLEFQYDPGSSALPSEESRAERPI